MQLFNTILPVAALVSTALGQLGPVHNTSREFNLKTAVISGQSGKSALNNLWLEPYHTGAGLNDVVLVNKRDRGVKGFLNQTSTKGPHGKHYNNMVFDFGSDFPWGLVMQENAVAYAAWEPVALNAGGGGTDPQVDGFFINSTGLQWTSSPSSPGSSNDAFAGWLACDWSHLEPQLFFAFSYYTPFKVPASCARVDLVPVYL